MYIIIGGGGEIGYYLTKSLLNQGHEVLLLEKGSAGFKGLAEELGQAPVASVVVPRRALFRLSNSPSSALVARSQVKTAQPCSIMPRASIMSSTSSSENDRTSGPAVWDEIEQTLAPERPCSLLAAGCAIAEIRPEAHLVDLLARLEVPLNDQVAELRRDFGMQGLPGHFSRNGCDYGHAIAQASGSITISV